MFSFTLFALVALFPLVGPFLQVVDIIIGRSPVPRPCALALNVGRSTKHSVHLLFALPPIVTTPCGLLPAAFLLVSLFHPSSFAHSYA